MVYRLRDTEREALVASMDKWLDEPEFHHLEIVRRVGRAKTTIGQLQADELAILQDGAAIVDEVVERFGTQGGRFEMRAVFQPESGPGTDGVNRKQLSRSFELMRSRAEERAKSEGSSAGIEQLTASFGAAFDTQGRQLSSSVQQQTQLMSLLLDRTEKHHTVHVQEITEYQRLIMDQQLELTEARIELAYKDREPVVTGEHLALVLPAVVHLLQSISHRLIGTGLPGAVAEGAAAAAVGAAENAAAQGAPAG
jgi:hypothetical protein